ncbi:MAG TPA: glycosyltransferase family 9 protein [Terriglobales bacterium]|nr:glycosyltransferase family 9 protein [Terriglobales bacterium]
MARPIVDPALIRRVLLVRPRFLGDVCLTLPALDAVRAACPGARVAYLVEREAAPLLSGDPRVDELIEVPRGLGTAGTARLARRLRRFAPEVAFDLFGNPRTALWTFLSGALVRVGYRGKGWRSALYTHHARPRTLSAIGFHLASLEALGWPAPSSMPRLHVSEAARAEAQRALDELGVPRDRRLVGLHPGARWPTRRWDPERFAALARRALASAGGIVVLITGAADEGERVARVLRGLPADRARGIVGWPLARLVALQSLCSAFVCGDTGPLHTAVAAGAPTLGLFSRNRPAMFFPYPPAAGHRAYYAAAECSPCHRDACADLRCLERLTVDGAWALLSGMLA